MDRELLALLMNAWDKVDSAAQRVLVAQPYQMTKAAEDLDAARLEMRATMRGLARAQTAPAR